MNNWLEKIQENIIWKFKKVLSTGENIYGKVTWIYQEDDIYKYCEEGFYLKTKFTQNYIYNFKNKTVSFVDGRLFFSFLNNDYVHNCNKDVYKITFGNYFIKYTVEGPKKDYISTTVFIFRNCNQTLDSPKV